MVKRNAIKILFASSITTSLAASEQPNFLVVVCEDISPYLGCYGDSVAKSPNLDKFANTATRHTSMYTTVGVSSPSRYSLIMGRYSSNDGANYMRSNFFDKSFEVVPPRGAKCFTEYLRQAGYYCTNNKKTDYQFNAPLSAWDENGVNAHWHNAPEGKPFYAQFNIETTHESRLWKNADKPLLVNPEDIILPPYFPDTEIVRRDMAIMYSNIALMDEQFAKYLKELEESDKADNTVVIFFSDNGGPLPRGKREILQSGTNVPFMIRMPKQEQPSIDDRQAMFVDIPATILSIAGVEIPATIQGKALYGKQKSKPRKYTFGATDRFDEQFEKRGAIRDDRFLYVRNYSSEQSTYRPVDYRLQLPMMRNMLDLYKAGKLNDVQSQWFVPADGDEQLYDYIADPHNVNNLADDPEYKKELKRMRKAYSREWITAYNKQWVEWEEDQFKEMMRPGGVKSKCHTPKYLVEDGVLSITNLDPSVSAVYKTPTDRQWQLYTSPVKIKDGVKVQIQFCRIGFSNSNIVTVN